MSQHFTAHHLQKISVDIMARAWGVLPLMGVSTFLLYLLSQQAPAREDDGDVKLTFPSDLESLRTVARALQVYSERNWWYVLILFGAAYTYKQAFCIPGSGVLNILAGALYGLPGGLTFVCIFTAVGATIAFMLSKTFYKESIQWLFPEMFRLNQMKIQENRDRLFYYMIFIRVVPVSPGWAINLVSPLLGVPLPLFFITTFLGLIPYNFMGVSSGGIITTLTSINDVFSWRTFIILLCIAGVILLPAFLQKRTKTPSHIKPA